MVEESDRLIRLVNDLLMLARADAGVSLTLQSVEVSPLLEETCRQVEQLDPERRDRPGERPRFEGHGRPGRAEAGGVDRTG